jgi:hypothetical protein
VTINRIRQSETFGFEIALTGDDTAAFTNTLNVMQYPGDTPAITRTITAETDTLTSAETAALAVGQWWIYITSSDTDENIQDPIKLYISKGWA